MKRYKNKYYAIAAAAVFLCLLLAAVVFYLKAGSSAAANVSLKAEKLRLAEGTVIKSDDGKRAEIQGSLPEYIRPEECLLFLTNGNAAEVFIDGQLVFSYGTDSYFCGNDRCDVEMLPSVYCVVPIPQGSETAPFAVKFTATYRNLNLPDLFYGTRSEAYYDIIRQNLFTVIFTAFSIVLGLTLVIFQVHSRFSRRVETKNRAIFHWGVFSIMLGIWVITDSIVLQMIFQNITFFFLLSFYTFMLMPVPFLLFIKDFCRFDGSVGKCYHLFAMAFAVNFIVQNLLYATGVSDLRRMLIVTHALIAALLILVFATLIRSYIRFRKSAVKYILCAMSVFAIFCLIQFFKFYFHGQDVNNSLYMRIGILLFTFTLAVFALRQDSALIEEATKIEMYKKLAMYDALTQCENRAAMDFYLKEAYPEGGASHTIGFAVIDLNNLKETNDTFGHTEGDKLLQGTAECLKASFDESVKFYRTGGDEFYIIFTDASEMEAKTRRLYDIVGRYNERHTNQISFAMGTCVDEVRDYRDFRRLLKLADDAMYVQKSQMHQQENRVF
ncbi:MAG: GGDEF domain-containing protein [Clostridia bacterium]